MVRALTSTTELARPMIAIIISAAPRRGTTATSSSGAAQAMTPKPKSVASLPRCARIKATNPPKNPPMPTVASSTPRPDLPSPSRSKAIATENTNDAPAMMVCAQYSDTRTRRSRLAKMTLKPVAALAKNPSSSSTAAWTRPALSVPPPDPPPVPVSSVTTARMPNTTTADQRNDAALNRYTTCTVATASSKPATAGPKNMATLSTVLVTTLAAVSSPGWRANDGFRARSAGRNAVPTSAEATART